MLADVLGTEQVSVDSHFFDDLGADSLVMAQFCARVRKRADLPSVSMKDVYQHPTIRSLATALADADRRPTRASLAAVGSGGSHRAAEARPAHGEYVLCGALQLLIFLGYSYLAALVAVQGYEWISAGPSLVDIYLRSVVFGGAAFLGLCTLPILAKWVLIGRWKPQRDPGLEPGVLPLLAGQDAGPANPLVLFVGSPLYALYLRALGAKIGRGRRRSSPGTCRCAPTCSPSATAR